MAESEITKMVERYAKRSRADARYSMLEPAVWQSVQERQRKLIAIFKSFLKKPIENATLLEIGCGWGMNLLELLRLGFRAENLIGNELLSDRIEGARYNLPPAVRLLPGDASTLPIPEASFDVVYQSTVFSSILDDAFQQRLAAEMWRWVRPGGGVLWYDFTYDNPNNPDVRGVTLRRVRELFPQGKMFATRLTLAPPISRLVTRLHPAAYTLFNVVPLLRTHVLCWIGKSE